MLSKKNRRNNKNYKGGSPALTKYLDSDPKPTFTEITREMVHLYGYPEKYIGYNVALPASGIENPFTIQEMCAMCWASQTPIEYDKIADEKNSAFINEQIDLDIIRGVSIEINGENIEKEAKDEKRIDYSKLIDSKLNGISEQELYEIKSLLNQFPVSVACSIMTFMLPNYKNEQINISGLEDSIIDSYRDIFPDIHNLKLINVTKVDNKIIIDETFFPALVVFDYSGKNPDKPIKFVGVGKAVVYCDFYKNIGFFIWKSVIKDEEEEQEQLDPEQAKTSINNIVLGSIGAAAVATGAVVGTLFGVGVLGGKSKKARKTRRAIRKNKKITRRTKKKRRTRRNKKKN